MYKRQIEERDLVKNIGMNIRQLCDMRSLSRLPRGHRNTMFNLLQGYIEAALMDFKEERSRQIMLSNGYNSETGNYTDIEGFGVFMQKGESYALLDPADSRIGRFDAESITTGEKDYIWDIRQLDLENKREVTQLDFPNLGSDARAYGPVGKIFVACSSRHYNALEYSFEGDKTSRNATAVRMGFARNMYIDRLDITIYEETFLKGAAENTMYGWMPRHVRLVKNKALDMEFSGVMPQIDRNKVVFRYKTMSNIRNSWRAGCFRIINACLLYTSPSPRD